MIQESELVTQAVNEQLTAEHEKDVEEMRGKYLTFFTDGQLFGIPIADVVQIVGVQPISPIPEFPSYAKGVINLRGSIIPIIDVRLRFNKEEAEYNGRTCIIVTLIGENEVGFIVDEVDAVVEINDNLIAPPPKIGPDSTRVYLTGVAKFEGRVVLIIKTAKLLTEETVSIIKSSVREGV